MINTKHPSDSWGAIPLFAAASDRRIHYLFVGLEQITMYY